MNHFIITTIAFISILAQGCVVENELDTPTNDLPEVDAPDRPEPDRPGIDAPGDDEVENPIGRPPHELDEDDGLNGIEHPIGDGDPDGEFDEGDHEMDGIEVPGDDDDDEHIEDGEPGVSGGDEDEDEDVDFPEIRDECEPNAGQCDDGFGCETLCEPSNCDDEGRCTQDCRIVYRCIEQ